MKGSFLKKVSIVIAIGCLLSISGCGNKEVSNIMGGNKKVTIRLWNGGLEDSPDADKRLQTYQTRMLREKFPNIIINSEPFRTGTDVSQEYDKALMAGIAPTAFDNFSYTTIPTRIANGTIADITSLFENWEYKDKMLRTFDGAITNEDKWYAIVRSAYVMGTSYNKKAIIEGGGDINNLPKTWEEFGKFGSKITDLSKPRFGYEIVGMNYAAWPFTAWVWSAGGEMVRPNGDGTFKIAFNEAPGIDAAMFMNEMIWKYKMTQKDVLQDWNSIQKDVKIGACCFAWLDLSWLNNAELERYGDLKMDDFGIMPMPVKDTSINRPGFSGGEVIVFNPKASKEEIKAAFEVMSYLNYDEEYLTGNWNIRNEMNTGTIQMPARKDLYEKMLSIYTSIPGSIKQDMLDTAKIAKAEPYCSNWSDLKDALVGPLQEIMLDRSLTREKAQTLMDECAEKLYRHYPESFRKQ